LKPPIYRWVVDRTGLIVISILFHQREIGIKEHLIRRIDIIWLYPRAQKYLIRGRDRLEDMGRRSGREYTILLERAEIIALYELGRPRRHQPHSQLPTLLQPSARIFA
jgi:hypothetical protein